MKSRRLLIVSNRLPVTISEGDAGPTLEPSTGGLATALRGVHEGGDMQWVGWPGEMPRGRRHRQAIASRLAELGTIPIDLSHDEVTQYYDTFSNGVLWPLFHYLLDKVRLDAERSWQTYEAVNRRFADEVIRHHRPGDSIWVHDYQLALVPGFIREQLPDARIGFFLHIPFPAPEVLRILPWRRELVRGMLGADLVGFHTAAFRDNFAATAAQVLGLAPSAGVVPLDGRLVKLGVHPIGIDTESFVSIAERPDVIARARALRDAAGGRKIVLGVDRLDYTKGIPRRLLAIDRLLQKTPTLRDRVQFVQIAVPSRERVDAYADLRRTVNELVGRINARHGTTSSVPVHLLYRAVPVEELVALYLAADVMLVTPLRDGMNLVAKEYVACRGDGDGVLVLSEFAGAAETLSGALQVNPYDLEAVGGALARAVEMAPAERRERMTMMRPSVVDDDAHAWARRFVDELNAPAQPAPSAVAAARLTGAMRVLAVAPERVLLLDYDGTLAPIAPDPAAAAPSAALLHLLGRLAALPRTEVHVVSGRSREVLDRWLGDLDIGLHAEHGFWSRAQGGAWQPVRKPPTGELADLLPAVRAIADRAPGALVELKASGIAFHHRALAAGQAAHCLAALRELVMPRLGTALAWHEGNKVVEVRAAGVDKGGVAARLVAGRRVGLLAAGDDATDEDLFAPLPAEAVTIRVGDHGPPRTLAGFRLAAPDELLTLLARLADDVIASTSPRRHVA